MFQQPPPTRFDLNFKLFRVPVRVSPFFWFLPIAFGAGTGDIWQLLIWVVVVFVSILLHEFGHSLAMRRYGWDSFIVLHFFGGLAIPESVSWGGRWDRTAMQQIVISLAGPVAGFIFAAITIGIVVALGGFVSVSRLFGIIPIPRALLPNAGWLINSVVNTILWINVFWGIINLVPVFPLDGGQVARAIFVHYDPWEGVRKSLLLSVIAGAVTAVVGLALLSSLYMTFLFGILAFQSYQSLQGHGGSIF